MNWFWLSLLYLLVHFSSLSLIWLVENCLAAKFAWLLSYCERLGRKKKDTYARTQTQSEFRNRENNENPKYKYYLATEFTQAPIHRNAMTTCIHQYTLYTIHTMRKAESANEKRKLLCTYYMWKVRVLMNYQPIQNATIENPNTDRSAEGKQGNACVSESVTVRLRQTNKSFVFWTNHMWWTWGWLVERVLLKCLLIDFSYHGASNAASEFLVFLLSHLCVMATILSYL